MHRAAAAAGVRGEGVVCEEDQPFAHRRDRLRRSVHYLGPMVRAHPPLTLLAFFLGTVLGCMNDDVVECDPETELRIVYGSDTTESSSAVVCEAAPMACEDGIDCECLAGHTFESGVRADFCLESGSCDDDDGTIEVVCPGG